MTAEQDRQNPTRSVALSSASTTRTVVDCDPNRRAAGTLRAPAEIAANDALDTISTAATDRSDYGANVLAAAKPGACRQMVPERERCRSHPVGLSVLACRVLLARSPPSLPRRLVTPACLPFTRRYSLPSRPPSAPFYRFLPIVTRLLHQIPQQIPYTDCLNTTLAIEIRSATVLDSIEGFTGMVWNSIRSRAAVSGGKMGIHVARIYGSQGARCFIIPLRSKTSQIYDRQQQLATEMGSSWNGKYIGDKLSALLDSCKDADLIQAY
ncbi:hypothetical protein C8R45DRAFT_1136391 [Mycena sanguinolenta]|nr:hypothetical protein C8R45DRAFT_1136391 [Mycena sanguinolenta]